MYKFARFAVNIYLFVLMLYFGLLGAWYFSYSCDFFYPVTYQILHQQEGYEVNLPQTAGDYTRFIYAGQGEHLRVFTGLKICVEHSDRDFRDVTVRTSRGIVPAASPSEIKQLEKVREVMNFYKGLWLPVLVMLVMILSIMIYYGFQPYRWGEFTKWMSAVYGSVLFFVWFFGIENFFDALILIVSDVRTEWFFLSPKSYLGVVLPYPGAYVSFILVVSVSALAFWAVLYTAGASLVKLFIDKNFL